MPTKKQRRRREKELRHEWEEVYVDSEGRELEPDEVERLAPPESRRAEARPKAKTSGRPQQGGARRPARAVQPASWRRAFKRAAIFAPLMYVFIVLTNRSTPPATAIFITLQLIVIFVPFSYLMDRFTYRLWQKRQAKPG
jgi:hypothetical protein